MNQMINQVDGNVNQIPFKVTNHGWYIACFEVQYTFEGKLYNIESGVFSLGMEKKVFVPQTATNVTITISAEVGFKWTTVESKFSKIMEATCFALYGTLFTPYALEVNCIASLNLGGITPPSGCNCCNCCALCKSSMSAENYMNYMNTFYNDKNK